MFAITRLRAILIVLVCLLGIIFALPNMVSSEKLPDWLDNKVNLGLELQGGSHLQLEVDLKTVNKEYLSHLIGEIRSQMRKQNIGYTGLNVGEIPKITINLRHLEDYEKAQKILRSIDDSLQVKQEGSTIVASLSLQVTTARATQIVDQSIEVIRRRIDETGTKEPTILRQGNDRIIVQLPGIDNPSEVKQRIGQMAKMSFHLVDDNAHTHNDGEKPRVSPGSGLEVLEESKRGGYVVIKKHTSLSGEHLIDAQVSTNHESGEIGVSLRFNNIGARKFAEISSNNIGKRFAIVLDGKVITAPVFRSAIDNGRAEITGNFDIKEANELALLLRAGSLPAPLKVIEERTVGPSLGIDSINDGQRATILAFIFVSIFMILSYSVFGVFANIALIFNLILLFAGLSLLQATLTLPGIAGIAMTIGMAVDANVLIYERIKEELRLGIKPLLAIEAGYKRAMATIVDSNLTTLIGAAVLYEFGSGPIRGFGITLALGIAVSMFTALSLTKLITAYWFRNKTIEELPI